MQRMGQEIFQGEQDKGQAQKQVDELNRQIVQAQQAQQRLAENAREKLHGLTEEIGKREQEISELTESIRAKDYQMAKVSVTEHLSREENKSFQEQMQRKDRQISDLQKELHDLRRKLDEVVMTRMSEGTAQLEIQHLKADNERLIGLLSQTKEFEQFEKLSTQ